MNKNGIGAIGAIMLFVVFIVMWFVWLGGFVSTIGNSVVSSNSLTGIEGFFFANLNITVLICLILGMLSWFYFGGSSQ